MKRATAGDSAMAVHLVIVNRLRMTVRTEAEAELAQLAATVRAGTLVGLMKDRSGEPAVTALHACENLAGIVRNGLVAPSRPPNTSVDCAEAEIKEQRQITRVPIPPRGFVADYVPFYHAPRSPMRYRTAR